MLLLAGGPTDASCRAKLKLTGGIDYENFEQWLDHAIVEQCTTGGILDLPMLAEECQATLTT